MKKLIALILTLVFTASMFVLSYASETDKNNNYGNNSEAESNIVTTSGLNIDAKAAVLINADTGALLYAKNPNIALPPASVTKIMTLLLVAEEIENGSIKTQDIVTVSSNAASMGGSQIFLKEGESFTVEELVKSTVIASANDAAVALAEYICGSEKEFVSRMNKRASELGMKNTYFENATGLDDTVTKHLTSAMDIGIMSSELIKHSLILKYSNVWQDSIRDGEFVLTNTNRLVRYYQGCTGLKTGSTDKAGFCISATAKRDNMHLIAVIMGAQTRDERNQYAKELLDYGFASYSLYTEKESFLEEVPVYYGTVDKVAVYSKDFSVLINRSDRNKIEKVYNIPKAINAPMRKDDPVGYISYKIGDKEIGRTEIFVKENIDKISYFELLGRVFKSIIVGK